MYGSGDAERLIAVSEESAALFRQAGDGHGAAHAPGMIGFAMLQMGDLDGATRIFGEVLENLKEQGDSWTSAHILNHMAVAPLRRGDYPRAGEHAQGGPHAHGADGRQVGRPDSAPDPGPGGLGVGRTQEKRPGTSGLRSGSPRSWRTG